MRTQEVACGVSAFAAMLLVASAASAQVQSKAQQNCIVKINKDGVAVQKRQGKIQAECVKRKTNNEFQGQLTATEDCINDDLHDKLVKNKDKTAADDMEYCGGLAAPNFGHTDAATVNNAAVNAERSLIHDIFGPNLDASLQEKDPNANEANCQRGVHKRVEQFAVTLARVFLKCKNQALAVDEDPFPLGADDAGDLATCVLNDITLQFDKRKQKIEDWIVDKCDPFSVSTTVFPGLCDNLSGVTLKNCLVDVTECRVCDMLNTMDGLSADCDALSGITCP